MAIEARKVFLYMSVRMPGHVNKAKHLTLCMGQIGKSRRSSASVKLIRTVDFSSE